MNNKRKKDENFKINLKKIYFVIFKFYNILEKEIKTYFKYLYNLIYYFYKLFLGKL
jgi:hypothetical protein